MKAPSLSTPAVAVDDGSADTLQLGRFDEFLGFRLRRIQNVLSKKFVLATADYGLRSGLFSSMAMIDANPGVSQNALAREVGLDKSVMVMIVDDLEKRGWAVRERSSADRRRHALSLSPAGKVAFEDLIQLLRRTESAVNERLSAAEIGMLHELLDRIHAVCVADAG